jgi:hypothetical protein
MATRRPRGELNLIAQWQSTATCNPPIATSVARCTPCGAAKVKKKIDTSCAKQRDAAPDYKNLRLFTCYRNEKLTTTRSGYPKLKPDKKLKAVGEWQ